MKRELSPRVSSINSWCPAGSAAWGSLGGTNLLEEGPQWGMGFGSKQPRLLTVCTLCFVIVVQDASLSFPLLPPCLLPPHHAGLLFL